VADVVSDIRCHRQWHEWIHRELPRPNLPNDAPEVIDLFAGCGGLALSFEVCGFRSIGYEMEAVAADTYSRNLAGECHEVFLETGIPKERNGIDVLIGGPPCQPFSQFGYQRGRHDSRDGLPVFVDAMNRFRPKIAILENVRGLLYRNKGYLRAAAHKMERLGYTVYAKLLKAVEFGVPQKRERVFVVASKVGWEWPDRFVDAPVTAGTALGPMAEAEDDDSRYLTPSMDRYIARYEQLSKCSTPRDTHLDKPARTLTCRNLGGATSDMHRLKMPSGKRRMLTVREGARLQSFPDWFEFSGNEYDRCKQIGNAVPPLMGLAVARQVCKALESTFSCNGRSSVNNSLLDSDRIAEKVEQALNIMRHVGIPVRDLSSNRRRERVSKALLAVARIKPDMEWSEASSHYDQTASPITTREIIRFWNEYYDENIADSSYDDVRRKDLDILVEAGLVSNSAADPTADVNDRTRGYSISAQAINLLRRYGHSDWEECVLSFREIAGVLKDRLSKKRDFKKVPVTLPDGSQFRLSPGPHNEIQKSIIEEFLPRFSKGAEVLYVGDASKKILYTNVDRMEEIGIDEIGRKTLPDIIAYESERKWLFLIEAVHSSNPISKMRHLKLKRLTENVDAGCLFVSAFATVATFSKFSQEISWETEVWIADDPEHMIHFNGGRFLSPYEQSEGEDP